MKSHILLACMVGMLFVPTVTLGEITMEDDDWEGEGDVWGYYASSGASAYGDADESGYSWAWGGYSLQTSEGGDFDWWYYYEASAYAYACRIGLGSVWASADGYADGTYGEGVSASVSVYVTWPSPSDSDYDEPDSETDNGTDEFSAYDSIYANHSVSASAGTSPLSLGWATANADAGAAIDLSEH